MQPLNRLLRPEQTQATAHHTCTWQASTQITPAYPALVKVSTHLDRAQSWPTVAQMSYLILSHVQPWTFKCHYFYIPPMITDYRGHCQTLLPVREINLKVVCTTNNTDINIPLGLGAEPTP